MNRISFLLMSILLFNSFEALCQTKEDSHFEFKIKPVLIDTESSDSTSLGIDYDLNYKKAFDPSQLKKSSDGTLGQDVNLLIKDVNARLRGTIASSAEKNPNKLVDFSLAGEYKLVRAEAYYYLGIATTYETDQSNTNKQYSYGLSTAVEKIGLLKNGDRIFLMLNASSVDPQNDNARLAADGNLDVYNRWNLEFTYALNTNLDSLRSVEFNYRRYQEISPSHQVKILGLDETDLSLIRFNLKNDFFVQYSKGELPFDKQSERAIKIGWLAKLE